MEKQHDLLGLQVEDILTGFKGLVIGQVRYLTGCNQILVQPRMKKGQWSESRWFDDSRAKVLGDLRVEIPTTDPPGPDKEAPRR